MKGDVRREVRRRYARSAGPDAGAVAGCTCCGGPHSCQSERLGYSREELSSIPAESDLGLGCGNPTALGEIQPGETVVDLGSGGGIDCFLAAGRVGPSGKVIGVDMTAEMIDWARSAALKGAYGNVEFRLGEIENLPVADATADVVVSNCVINLSQDKARVFREAFRVLKPGGRMMISDIVLREELPEKLRANVALWTGCISGALLEDEYLRLIREAGFSSVSVAGEKSAGEMFGPEQAASLLKEFPELSPEELKRLGGVIWSIQVKASK